MFGQDAEYMPTAQAEQLIKAVSKCHKCFSKAFTVCRLFPRMSRRQMHWRPPLLLASGTFRALIRLLPKVTFNGFAD